MEQALCMEDICHIWIRCASIQCITLPVAACGSGNNLVGNQFISLLVGVALIQVESSHIAEKIINV